MYKNIFMVTETLQNGKERRLKKSVLTTIWREKDGKTVHFGQEDRIAHCVEILKAHGYYDIEFVKTIGTTILM